MPIPRSRCSEIQMTRQDQEQCRTSHAASVVASRTRRFAIIGRPGCGKRQPCARLVIPTSLDGTANSRRNQPGTGSMTSAACSAARATLSAGWGNRSRSSVGSDRRVATPTGAARLARTMIRIRERVAARWMKSAPTSSRNRRSEARSSGNSGWRLRNNSSRSPLWGRPTRGRELTWPQNERVAGA